jgi:hypothetical protein
MLTLRWEKSLAVRVLVNDKYQAMNENEKSKILQPIIRKFPAIQWNRQNVILFHETTPFK